MAVLISIGVFVLILSFLVIIHELGHFVAAKWAKIKVEEFGLGYPPRALKLFTKWGTLFSLNWVPFGGFVRMEGEEGEAPHTVKTTKTEGAFYEKSAVARLVVILAGATVNFIFGIIAFGILFTIVGIPQGAIVDAVAGGSPAETAGVPVEAAVVGFKANGQTIKTRSSGEIIAFVDQHRGQTVDVMMIGPCQGAECQQHESTYTTYIRTKEETPADQGALGLRFRSEYTRFYPWYEMPFRGAAFGTTQALGLGWLILQALRDLLTDLFTRGAVPQDIAGPIGIVDQANSNQIFSQGPLALLSFAGMLSINLAVMNVLPIPALDGGRALFIILEKVVGKKAIQKVEAVANYGGFAFLIGLIIIISARDIFRIIMRAL